MAGELVPFGHDTAMAELPPGGYLSSYQRGNMAEEIAMIRAVQGRDFGLDDCVGQEIDIEHLCAHWAGWTDPMTGETGDSVRTVLISPDGTRYATRSATVRADIGRVVQLLGRPMPFRPALRFLVKKVKSLANGRQYLQLVLQGEAPTNDEERE